MTREGAILRLERERDFSRKMEKSWSKVDWKDRPDHLADPRSLSENHRMYAEALDMAIAALREQPRWIPVTERLPDGWWIDPETGYGEPEEYIVFVKGAIAPTVANYINDKFVNISQDATGFADEITHWMPLPEPPEVEV